MLYFSKNNQNPKSRNTKNHHFLCVWVSGVILAGLIGGSQQHTCTLSSWMCLCQCWESSVVGERGDDGKVGEIIMKGGEKW